MLGELTIVITTYKRYGFLKRLLLFYFSYNSDVKFVVLDSTPYLPKDEELIKILGYKSVDWKRYSQDIFFAHKIADGCKYINTEYAVLCADDDFLIPTSLNTCINYLSKHLDYSSVHGFYFSHTTPYKNKDFYMAPLYSDGKSLEEETGAGRIFSYLSGSSKYYPMYAVHRTQVFKIIWSETKEYVSDLGLSELFPSSLSLIYGKMKILPVFYISREANNFNWMAGLENTWNDKMYSDEKITHAVVGLGKHLSKNDLISIEEARKIVFDAFQYYLNNAKLKYSTVNSSIYNAFFHALKKIKDRVKIRTRIRKVMYNYLYNGCHPSIYPEYLDDFILVKEAVLLSDANLEEMNISRKEMADSISLE